MLMAVPRYAIYFAPGLDTPLGAFGASVLGYDSHSGRTSTPMLGREISPLDGEAATAEPRRYGFHATLKAPFRLRPSADEQGLRNALAEFTTSRRAVVVGPLELSAEGGFIVLRPRLPELGPSALAQACVEHFEPFRAPLTDEEIRRRRPEKLTARQRELLEVYGYPHVAEHFRFHMTLAGPLAPMLLHKVHVALADRMTGLDIGPIAVDHIALLKQDAPGAVFRVISTELLAKT
jgi:hypothetical protein